MPTPQEGEEQQDFHSRCMSQLVGEEGYEQDQANAICYSVWRKEKGEENVKRKSENWRKELTQAIKAELSQKFGYDPNDPRGCRRNSIDLSSNGKAVFSGSFRKSSDGRRSRYTSQENA